LAGRLTVIVGATLVTFTVAVSVLVRARSSVTRRLTV
jgi:hypothetical protein